MTNLQKVEFELLKCFVNICDQLNLQYYLVCGSALGAVKYNGFIPWDDDIDVGMPREAYEIFLDKAPQLLEENYFLQNYHSEPNFPAIYSKLRNSDTTFLEKSAAKLNINHGVYIDIFPLDGYPQKLVKQWQLEYKKNIYKLQIQTVFEITRSFKAQMITNILRLMRCNYEIEKTIRKYERLISAYLIEESDLICNHGNWQGKLEYAPKEQYGKGIWATFEGIRVRIPERYDEYLTQKYGDWRADLPKEQQVGHHYYEICDLDKPYTYYTKQNCKKN